MNFRIGRPEWTFGALLLVYSLLSLAHVTGMFMLVLKVAVWAFGSWFFIRFTRTLVRRILWRLRNRLIVAYVFIALVPVVLITLLAGLGALLVGGQICVYLLTAELERRTAGVRTAIEFLAQNGNPDRAAWAQTIGPVFNARN